MFYSKFAIIFHQVNRWQAFNWISIEPHTPDVPVYGIMDSTEIGLEDTQSIVDYEPVDYSITDESNYVDFGYTNYY